MIKLLLKKFISALYTSGYYKKLIRIYKEDKFELLGIRTLLTNKVVLGGLKPPDYFYDNSEQRRLIALFDDEKSTKCYQFEARIFEVDAATLMMPSGLIRVKNGLVKRLMGDTYWALHFPRYWISFAKSYLSPKREVASSISLTLPFVDNYYHWLIETLPRIALLEMAGFKPGDIRLVMPANNSSAKFVHECLNLVGWGNNVNYLGAGAYKVRNLIVPSLTCPPSKISPVAAAWLRQKLLSPNADTNKVFAGFERIYIARDDSPSRRVANISEVDELMKKHGFVKVTMSGKTVSEQAQLFAAAKYIVGIHGAALSNVIFCQNGARLLEIFMDGWFTKAFFNLSRDRGMSYGCFLAKNVGGNLLVDTQDLDELMTAMFESI